MTATNRVLLSSDDIKHLSICEYRDFRYRRLFDVLKRQILVAYGRQVGHSVLSRSYTANGFEYAVCDRIFKRFEICDQVFYSYSGVSRYINFSVCQWSKIHQEFDYLAITADENGDFSFALIPDENEIAFRSLKYLVSRFGYLLKGVDLPVEMRRLSIGYLYSKAQ